MRGPPVIQRATVGNPVVGFYKRKLVKNGPWVPARLYYSTPDRDADGEPAEDERLLCEVNGERRDPFDQWSWVCGHPISEAEYLAMRLEAAGASFLGEATPEANPRQPMNLARMRSVF